MNFWVDTISLRTHRLSSKNFSLIFCQNILVLACGNLLQGFSFFPRSKDGEMWSGL